MYLPCVLHEHCCVLSASRLLMCIFKYSRCGRRKGFYFLYYLQTVAGGDEPFEAFMRDYLKTFAHGNVDSNTFKQYYLDYFKVCQGSWPC